MVTELKARGGSAVIVAHRPAAFEACDDVVMMEDGRLRSAVQEDGILPRPAASAGARSATVPVRVVSGPPAMRGGALTAVRKVEPEPGANPSGDGSGGAA